MPGGFCITDQITDQYAPYCSELRYAVSSDYIELADCWWMQQEMNTLFLRHHCLLKVIRCVARFGGLFLFNFVDFEL